MAITIEAARAQNALLRTTRPSLVAVFVGGTSGIGEETAKHLARSVDRPTIYIVGRNETAGSRIVEEMKTENSNGSYYYLPADVSELKNVDKICQELQTREKSLDLLFLSPGSLALSKQETPSGIDRNHLLRYYSRMRFVYNLLPLLQAAVSPRVISVLAGGKEGRIDKENLDLRKEFSFSTSNGYPSAMTSLVFEYLATKYPSISFIHEFPGIVATPILKSSMGNIAGTILGFILKPISMSSVESGEWNVFLSTSPNFPPKDATPASGENIEIAKASNGTTGGGSYILNYNGQDATNHDLMAELRESCPADFVWDHTLKTFDTLLA
ncbi:hypothetical protein DTO271G3_592 [Paecilomyces variotii]|nr:hypothetical protein DTO271G3_592 [Paecilomyces variotii]